MKELFLADKDGKIVQSLPTTITDNQMDMMLFELPFFYRYKGKSYYKNPLLDQVYQVRTPLQLEAAYTIYTGPMVRSKNDLKNPQNLAQQISVRNIVESDRILLITYAYQNIFHNLMVPYWMASSNQDVLISLLTEDNLEKQSGRFKNISSSQNELANRKSGDNPILVVAKLK